MTDTSSLANAGLFTREGAVAPVPLTGVSIDAEISGPCAKVAVAHRYENREDSPIEAVYVFPVDDGAAVCGFEAIVDGTLVVGEVRERDQAFEEYDQAMEDGHGAFLLDEERPDVFQASVGNLPPGKDVLVRITYVTELEIDGGRLRFVIPTTVSPRYAPAEDRTGTGRPDSEALNPPVAWQVPYGLELKVRLSMPGGITSVESPSHSVSIALGDGSATVTLAQARAALDRDFVLAVDAAGAGSPQAWIERTDDGGEAVAVAFVPQFSREPSPAEVLFVIDRSGSMEGTSIEEVRKALQLCLRSMIPGCRFNIIGFGSCCEPLFPESRAYDQASLTEASAHAAALRADLGGTEILSALRFALEQPRHGTLARQLVVLTDGEVTNTDAVLALVKEHAATARLFTLGIGAGASRHLVRGMARAGRGCAEFISPGERVEPKVVRLFGRLLSPALTDVALEWIGSRVVQSPAQVPPVFAGSRLLVYGFATGGTPRAVRMSGSTSSGPVMFDVPLDAVPCASGRVVATLAARARIRELEEGGEWLNARGSRQMERKQSGARHEIVDLGIRYGLISRETSFVAIERRETPVQGDVQLRRVPVALTSGWGGLERRAWRAVADWSVASMRHCDRLDTASQPAEAGVMLYAEPSRLRAAGLSFGVRAPVPEALGPVRYAGRVRPELRLASAPPAEMDALVRLQKADGSWELTPELGAILGRSLAELEAALDGSSGSRADALRAWATALALAWLHEHAGSVAVEWQMLAAKAREWIDNVAAVPPDGWTWIDAARRFLSEQGPGR